MTQSLVLSTSRNGSPNPWIFLTYPAWQTSSPCGHPLSSLPKMMMPDLQFLWHSRFSSFFTASHLPLPKLRPQAHAPLLHILWQRISNESCKSARHKLLSHQSRRMLLFASSSTVITCVCALSLWHGLDGLRPFHSHHWWLVQVQTSAVLEEMMKLHSWVGCFWLAPKSKQECE